MDLLNIPHLLSNRSEPKNNRDRRRSRARQEKTQHSSKNKSINFDNKESIERAISRFNQDPLPKGIPSLIDPPPEIVELDWITNGIPKSMQKSVGELVCLPGEFGWLPEERVSEIAKKIEHLSISLEQALSLRSALNQEKSVSSVWKHKQKNFPFFFVYDDI